MNKRKCWIYAIFAVVAIVGLAIALILIPKDDETIPQNNNKTPSNSVYATSFSVNLPNTIELPVGAHINFLTGYVSVNPSSVIEKLSIETETNNISNAIIFENNKLTANTVGTYSIKFKIPKSESMYFSKTITIKVKPYHENNHISVLKNSIQESQTCSLDEMFSISDGLNYEIITDSNINFDNNVFTAINVGLSEITFVVKENYLEYIYVFEINIQDLPEYEIVINNVTNNTITLDTLYNDVKHINFEVIDRNNEQTTQLVKALSNNEDVVIVEESYDDLLIKIRAVSVGEATLTLYLISNPAICVEINIVVE